MAQKDIQSVLQEDRVFPPSAQFRKHATLKAGELQRMYDKAAAGLCRILGGSGRRRNRLAAALHGAAGRFARRPTIAGSPTGN